MLPGTDSPHVCSSLGSAAVSPRVSSKTECKACDLSICTTSMFHRSHLGWGGTCSGAHQHPDQETRAGMADNTRDKYVQKGRRRVSPSIPVHLLLAGAADRRGRVDEVSNETSIDGIQSPSRYNIPPHSTRQASGFEREGSS
jgi:hypothetical protein